MAKLSDILGAERQRSDAESRRVIHLYLEGSFLRAYEWSAWLCCRYVNGFKATRRVVKGTDDSIVFIGFPVTSIYKYRAEGREICSIDDRNYDIILAENLVQQDLNDADFNNWKQSIQLSESKKKQQDATALSAITSTAQPVSLTGIMQQILAFPIERKSPLECMVFMADVKQQLAAII